MRMVEQGELIRNARIAKGLTQKDIADYLGMSDKNYSKIELGQIGLSLDYISKLCQLLGISEIELLADRKKRGEEWKEYFYSDIAGMFNGSINGDRYVDLLLKTYLSDEEITYFKEVMKLKKVRTANQLYLMPAFLDFMSMVERVNRDEMEAFFEYIRVFSKVREVVRNNEFIPGRD